MQLSGKILPCCPHCSSPIEELPVKNEWADAGPAKAPAERPKPAPVVVDFKLPIQPAGVDLVEMMAAELVAVENEIAHLEVRKAYAGKLRRMLAAANSES